MSFILVCGIFVWKRICAVYLSFVYIRTSLELEIQLLRGKCWSPHTPV